MKLVHLAMAFALLAGPAYGQSQSKPMPRYGEIDDTKTPSEIENERKAAADYKRSLGNVPNAAPVDPWGSVRGDGGTKPAAKAAPAKQATKSAAPAKER